MQRLKLYFTTDVHGSIFPTDYRDDEIKDRGLLALAKCFHKDENTLIIDGGDILQGSPFMTYYHQLEDASKHHLLKGIHPLASIMNGIGYDYVTLGNHDFNYGFSPLSEYMNQLNAACLCANVHYETEAFETKPYVIQKMPSGLTVGILGVTTDFIPVWEKPENLKGFTVEHTLETVEAYFGEVRAQCDVLIGLYHGGFETALDTGKRLSTSSENIAYRLCKSYDFDILLTGHQHMSIINQTLFGTHIVQLRDGGIQAAEVHIDVVSRQSEITSKLVLPKGDDIDAAIAEPLTVIRNAVSVWLDTPIGHLDRPLLPEGRLDMAIHGNGICDFINQIQLDETGADISCTSLANELKGFNADVTVRDVVSTYVYPNTLMVLEVTGTVLKSALEKCASYFERKADGISVSKDFLQPKVEHYNYDFYANLSYTIDLTKPPFERVTEILVKGNVVQAEDVYTLAMNNYRASGTGGYECFTTCPVIKTFPYEMTDLIIAYFEKHPMINVNSYHSLNLIG